MNYFVLLFVSVWAPHYPNSPKFAPPLYRYNSVRVHPYAHPKHMKVLKHFLYIPWHHNVIWASPYPNFPKFSPHLHRYNSEKVHPYQSTAYEGANHFKCIQYGFGMQSVVVYSLNHNTTLSFELHLTPIFQKFGPHLHRYNSVRVHPYAHPQHMKVLKHFI